MAFLLFLILVVLVVVFSIRISQLNGSVRAVEEKLKTLLGRMSELDDRLPPGLTGTLRGRISPTEPSAPGPVKEEQRTLTPATQLPAAAQPIPKPVQPPPHPSRSKEEWEALIGGRLLNRIGALALIIGMGFFLKYAFDRNWITEAMRVSIGGVAGLLLLIGAAVSHKKGFAVFSQGLVGAGIATLYLSVYASFSFYSLVSQPVAFLLMASVTVIGFAQAFRYDSLAVALLGWLGGFMTPFLLSTGTANEVGLFSYLGLLDAGLVLVVIRKDAWMILEPLALGATFSTYLAWYFSWYSSSDLLPTVFFLTLFWSLFLIPDLYRFARGLSTFSGIRRVAAQCNIILYYIALYAVVEPDYHEWMGPATFALGLIYVGWMAIFQGRAPESRSVEAQYAVTGIALFVVGTAVQCEGFATVIWWSIEALALVAAWTRWRLNYLRLSASLLFVIGALKMMGTSGCFSTSPASEFAFRVDGRLVAYLALTAALGSAALLLRSAEGVANARIRQALHYGWAMVFFIFLTVEVNDFFRSLLAGAGGDHATHLSFARYLTLTVVWLAYGLVLVKVSLETTLSPLLISGIGIFSLAGIVGGTRGVAFSPIAAFTPVVNERVGVLLLLIAGAWMLSAWLRAKGSFFPQAALLASSAGILTVLLILVLLSGETRDYFEKEISAASHSAMQPDRIGDVGRLENLKQLSLSGVWLVCSIGYLVAGIWRRRRSIRIISIVLFSITILKIFLYDLSSLELLYRIFSFLGLGLVLLAVSFLYQRYRTVIFGGSEAGKP